MEQFYHIIKAKSGLHARNAVQLAMVCQNTKSSVRIICGERVADAGDPIELMSLCAVAGEELICLIEGEEEKQLSDQLKRICRQWL